ncbi:O-antigen ligase [Bradyrhizobium lablabi]|uniref:O-antigen ligase n=1 Tax=Bradyrhizobium lablabi TaxID=722472 RepID=A0A1M6V594_9BRAD|nr:O-antigen ligase family protein [Bradyrhizobium lablabi]SHK76659.1 O-antigen ligase [Bradyrhizobium lablabi]
MLEAVHKTTRNAGIFSVVRSAAHSSFWLLCVDMYPVLVGASIPWSTSGVAIFMVIWFLVLIPTLDPSSFLNSLKRPACSLPLAFFALAVIGTLWADSSWSARLHGISSVTKLLAIPFLLYHFERSQRGNWVFVAFLVSCALLMGLSWIVLFAPDWKITANEPAGVPIKNYIDQSQEFALCIFALASFALTLFNQRRLALATVCATLMFCFFANMMFVVSARTALLYMPVLLILFAVRHLDRGATLLLFAGAMATAILVWLASPYLRQHVEHVAVEYQEYHEANRPTSTGLRLEYWSKSIESIGEAPLFGKGTGSTQQLFDREALGKSGAWPDSINNPHNQTLYVAVQWGALGCFVLYAMWYFHLLLFRATNFAAWIGLIVVVQNVVSSLLNSHLFDFQEGWIYVLGVGVAGGLAARAKKAMHAHSGGPSAPIAAR